MNRRPPSRLARDAVEAVGKRSRNHPEAADGMTYLPWQNNAARRPVHRRVSGGRLFVGITNSHLRMDRKCQRTISDRAKVKHRCSTFNACPWSGAMSKAVVAEAREILLLMSMLAGLSALSLAVACAAVVIADNQTQHVAALAMSAALHPGER